MSILQPNMYRFFDSTGREITELDFGRLDPDEEGEVDLYVSNASMSSIARMAWKSNVEGLEITGPQELFSGHKAPLTIRWKPGSNMIDAQVSVEGRMV